MITKKTVFLYIAGIIFLAFSLSSCNKRNYDSTISNNSIKKPEIDSTVKDFINAICGTWTFDADYVEEYLREGANLQKKWCGTGWSESEILKRKKTVIDDMKKNGAIIYTFNLISGDSLEWKINGPDEKKNKVIYSIEKIDSVMFSYKEYPQTENVINSSIKWDGKYLYMMMKLTPSLMNCTVISNDPPYAWTGLRFKRQILKNKEN
jgi:hypothetical protein